MGKLDRHFVTYINGGGDKMPVILNPFDSSIQLKFNVGVDDEGNPILKTKTLSGIKNSVSDQDLMDVAQALAGLQQYTLAAVVRVNEGELLNS